MNSKRIKDIRCNDKTTHSHYHYELFNYVTGKLHWLIGKNSAAAIFNFSREFTPE